MQYPGRPHGGEGRSASDDVGSVASDIFEGGSQLEAQEMVEELNQVGSTAFPFTVADVPAVMSLLAGISDEAEEEGRAEVSSSCDPRGDPPPSARSWLPVDLLVV